MSCLYCSMDINTYSIYEENGYKMKKARKTSLPFCLLSRFIKFIKLIGILVD